MSVETNLKIRDDASQVIAGIDKKIDSLNDKVDLFNSSGLKPSGINETAASFNLLGRSSNNLLGSFGQLGMGLYGLQIVFKGISNIIITMAGYSDTLSETTARLDLMNDGLLTTNQLWDEIYQSSMRSRGSITDVADAVAKMGLMTEGIFNNNYELVQFSENLTKSFKIAGTSTQGISSAMLQLTQAMASGVLRGEELNSIFENAPLLIRNIADYMGVPVGEIRQLASEGKITADIVKNAILGATDEINEKFEAMPMKFSELGTQYSNIWYNNMSMAQSNLESIPQKIADATLPVWDALTYAIFADLEGVQQEQQKAVNNTISMYGYLAEQVSIYTGQTISKQEAMKISFLSSFEFLESVTKKTFNALIEAGDFTIDTVAWTVDETVSNIVGDINQVAKAIDSLTGGLTNLSATTSKWANTWSEKAANSWNEMNTYENRFNDKYFGVSLNKLPTIITEQAIQKVITDKNTNINNISNYKPTTFKPIDLGGIGKGVNNIAKDVSNISKGIDNLNGISKSIQEINEATYHNNVANQFNGNIEIVAYGVDEEGQKAIGKQTEEAIRRVFYQDYQNMQAVGVYS